MGILAHNRAIRILDNDETGLYRVVLVDQASSLCALVRLDTSDDSRISEDTITSASPNEVRRKAAPEKLTGQLIWKKLLVLEELTESGLLAAVDIELANFNESPASRPRFEDRLKVMADFLHYDTLRASILDHGSIGALVTAAVNRHKVSRYMIYKCWSLLCKYGFVEQSLRPRLDRCGAPGVVRDCSPNGRKKSGRKTNRERISIKSTRPDEPSQPGMSAHWRQIILMADMKIKTPKPKFSERYDRIVKEGFVRFYCESNGSMEAGLIQGQYPNKEQVKRVLKIEIPQLQHLIDSTTRGHYKRSKRPLRSRSWKGVQGPGHTWAIDSTVADIYLRSSINRAWIIGRPIVYVMVDVWSTAVVGFYVCLAGPSWETAKVSLFSSAVNPEFLGRMWGFNIVSALVPYPGLPATLMCDRGEYLSAKAKETIFDLIPCASYAPPYRPDMKGLAEVLHRIEKDHEQWVPGAIDARRAEYELRKFDPNTGIFNVREYTEFLSGLFLSYNLTANRKHRLDTTMIADGVVATPAGLWRWGHEVGIGTDRYFSQSTLIQKLLPEDSARVTRQGIKFQQLAYQSEATHDLQWSGHARNFGGWDLTAHYFPGNVASIWTPAPTGSGMLELSLMEQSNAARWQSFEEVRDAFTYYSLGSADIEHRHVKTRVGIREKQERLVATAKELTAKALNDNTLPSPTLTEARQLEILLHGQAQSVPQRESEKRSAPPQDAYISMMQNLLTRGPTR